MDSAAKTTWKKTLGRTHQSGDVEETNTNLYFPMADSASPMASMQQSRHDLRPLGTYFGHPMQADLNNEAVMML